MQALQHCFMARHQSLGKTHWLDMKGTKGTSMEVHAGKRHIGFYDANCQIVSKCLNPCTGPTHPSTCCHVHQNIHLPAEEDLACYPGMTAQQWPRQSFHWFFSLESSGPPCSWSSSHKWNEMKSNGSFPTTTGRAVQKKKGRQRQQQS